MRVSKIPAMCMKVSDVTEILERSVPGFMPGFGGFQKIIEPLFKTELNNAHALVAYIPRIDCENDPSYRQFIIYAVVRSSDAKVLVYNRQAKDAGVGESRLAGAASIGFGGHSELEDCHQELPWDSLMASMHRELCEELHHDNGYIMVFEEEAYASKLLGIINSSATDVDKVHLAIVVSIDLPYSSEEMNSYSVLHSKEPDQIKNIRWVPVESLNQEANLESWSAAIVQSNVLVG